MNLSPFPLKQWDGPIARSDGHDSVHFSPWSAPASLAILEVRGSVDNDVCCSPVHPTCRRAGDDRRQDLVAIIRWGQSMGRATPRVLVVDDDLPICAVIELALADEGWDVQTCTRGDEALEVLQRRAVDAILLDLVLPDIDAETFLARCRQQGAGDTPVVLVSAAANLEEHAARLGVSGALAKPFDIDDLCALVRQVAPHDRAVSATGAVSRGRRNGTPRRRACRPSGSSHLSLVEPGWTATPPLPDRVRGNLHALEANLTAAMTASDHDDGAAVLQAVRLIQGRAVVTCGLLERLLGLDTTVAEPPLVQAVQAVKRLISDQEVDRLPPNELRARLHTVLHTLDRALRDFLQPADEMSVSERPESDIPQDHGSELAE